MKRIVSAAFSAVLLVLVPCAAFSLPGEKTKGMSSSASSAPVQIFMPETVCVGDKAELRYIFHSELPLMEEDELHRELSVELPSFTAQSDRCTVLSASVDRFGHEYTISLMLIGWRVGSIDFAPFVLGDYLVDFEPVEIASAVEKNGAQGFRPPSPPLVVPGTTMVLGILAVVLFVCFALVVFALFHVPAIADFFTRTHAERVMRRNMRAALKKLRQLEIRQSGMTDQQFCASLQHILRGYLGKRFYRSFASVESGAVYETFVELCGGDLDDAQDAMVQQILGILNRTDYIRYAHEMLQDGERQQLVVQTSKVISEAGGSYAEL